MARKKEPKTIMHPQGMTPQQYKWALRGILRVAELQRKRLLLKN